MNYSFFLFSKLYENWFHQDDDLEYDLLFDKLEPLYAKYFLGDFNDQSVDEYTCINNFFKNLKENEKNI